MHVEIVTIVDILSALEFNDTGRYLAAGDNGGRVVIFQQGQSKENQGDSMVIESDSKDKGSGYHFYSEFQSHEPEFDYLNSTDIQERINVIQWIPMNPNSLSLLSTNGCFGVVGLLIDKTIKLWRLCEKHLGKVPCPLLKDSPDTKEPSPEIIAQNKRIYGHAHSFNIHSLSCFSDGETFISADFLRINLWNLEVDKKSFSMDLQMRNN